MQEPPKDPFTLALAEILTAAVRDQWVKFPTKGDFYEAAAAAAGVNAETIARLLRAETSIRTDYLFHMAALLDTKASDLVAAAERAAGIEPEPLPGDGDEKLRRLRNGTPKPDDRANSN